MYLDHSFVCKS